MYISTQQKTRILEYASISKEGQEALIKEIYKCAGKRILNYLEQNKTKMCYVHFSFADGKSTPVIIIDNNPLSNLEMFCIKYIKYIDY